MSKKNLYAILELSYDCTKDDIERAYYFYAKMYHSEINSKTGNLYKELTDAYNILINPIKRKEYDLNECILSKAALLELNELTKYNTEIPTNILDIVTQCYNEFKASLELKDIITKILEKINITDYNIISAIKTYINAKKEEDDFKKEKVKNDILIFPFDWYAENQYYADADKQPIFEILNNINNYRFENICKSIYNRSLLSIFGVLFVYLLVLPLIIRNKIFKIYIPTNNIIQYEYKIKWLRYFIYLEAKQDFCNTLTMCFILQLFIIAKIIGNILHCLYWIFDRILKVFILPFAYVFKWIILGLAVLWLLSLV